MRKSLFAGVALVLAASAGDLSGQQRIPLSIEGRVDYAVPMGDFEDMADEGVSGSVGGSVGLAPGVGAYATYNFTRFRISPIASEPSDADDTGFSMGLTTALPRFGAVTPWVGAGAVFHQLELNGTSEGIEEKIGFEVGGGLALGLSRNVRLTPGVGYRRYHAEIPTLLGGGDVDVQYVTAGVGLNISF
jgi:opacity protein-like surface antigen